MITLSSYPSSLAYYYGPLGNSNTHQLWDVDFNIHFSSELFPWGSLVDDHFYASSFYNSLPSHRDFLVRNKIVPDYHYSFYPRIPISKASCITVKDFQSNIVSIYFYDLPVDYHTSYTVTNRITRFFPSLLDSLDFSKIFLKDLFVDDN